MLEWLLDNGADPNAVSPEDSTALSSAANHATPADVDLLLARGARLDGSNALHSAVARDTADEERFGMMQHLLDLRIDINALKTQHVQPSKLRSGPRGRGTALHQAVRAGKAGRVKWLLEHGADTSAKVEGGRTALEWAEDCEQEEIAAMLRQHEA